MATSHYFSLSLDSYSRAVVDQDLQWYTLASFTRLINQLSLVNFSTAQARNDAIGILTSLSATKPYGIADSNQNTTDVRFSTLTNAGVVVIAKHFVAAFCDGWPEIFGSLMNALNYKDRAAEKTLDSNNAQNDTDASGSTPNPAVVRSEFRDAQRAFQGALATAKMYIRNGVGVYNYRSFEDKYNLTWTTTPE